MNRNLSLTLAAALALAACTPDFDPASRVEKLRVLAIRAEPPEIEPTGAGTVDRAALTTLVLRPDFEAEPLRTTTVVHVACLPAPGSPGATPCQSFDALRDIGTLVTDVLATACAPEPSFATTLGRPFLAGVEACQRERCGEAATGGTPLRRAEVAAPGGYFDALAAAAPGHPELVLGVQAVVLSFVVDASPDELAGGVVATCPEADVVAGLGTLWSAREHVLATKRVIIRGPGATDPRNENPEFDGIFAGTTLAEGAATPIPAGTLVLSPVPNAEAEALHQTYAERDAAGLVIEAKREEWVYSWFSTAGEIDELHAAEGEDDQWTVGGAAGGAPALIAAVVRDLRGGVNWQVREVRVEP